MAVAKARSHSTQKNSVKSLVKTHANSSQSQDHARHTSQVGSLTRRPANVKRLFGVDVVVADHSRLLKRV